MNLRTQAFPDGPMYQQAPTPENIPVAHDVASGVISSALLRGTLLVGAIQVGSAALRYGSSVLFARWIGQSGYGNYSYAIALSQVLAVVAALGLPISTLRFVPEYVVRRDWPLLRGLVRRSRQCITTAGIVCALLATGALIGARPANLNLIVLMIGVWLTPIVALSYFESEMTRSLHRLGISYSPQILDPLVSIALALILMRQYGYLSATLVIIARSASLALALGLQLIGSQTVLPREARRAEPKSETALWVGVSFQLLLVGSYTIILSRADVLVLGLFRPARDVGLYSAAAATAALGSLVLGAANAKGVPTMSAMFASGDKPGLERVVHTVTLWAFWPSLAIAIAFWAVGDRVLGVFGPGFSAGYWPLAILAAGQVVNSGTGPVVALAIVTGQQNVTARVFGWCAAINIVLCLALVPHFGLLGAAFAASVTLALMNIWLHQIVSRTLGIRPAAALTGLRPQTVPGLPPRQAPRWNETN